MNVPWPCARVAQSSGKLIAAVDYNASGTDYTSMAVLVVTEGEPAAVIMGEVVDDMVNLAFPGLIPVAWKRLYCSGRRKEHTPLGRGGWTHALHQRIEAGDERATLRNGDRRNGLVETPPCSTRQPRTHPLHQGEALVGLEARDGDATSGNPTLTA